MITMVNLQYIYSILLKLVLKLNKYIKGTARYRAIVSHFGKEV